MYSTLTNVYSDVPTVSERELVRRILDSFIWPHMRGQLLGDAAPATPTLSQVQCNSCTKAPATVVLSGAVQLMH